MNQPRAIWAYVHPYSQHVLVDMDVFLTCADDLADHYRARGLEGLELDEAIVAALPHALAAALFVDSGTIN